MFGWGGSRLPPNACRVIKKKHCSSSHTPFTTRKKGVGVWVGVSVWKPISNIGFAADREHVGFWKRKCVFAFQNK